MSPLLKARVSGGWVDTDAVGGVRVAGATVPFGPEDEGPAYETLSWPDEPSLTNLDDGSQSYNMGIRFAVTESVQCAGVQWRVPDGILAPAGPGHFASIWDENPIRHALEAFTPIPGGYQNILFTGGPITLGPGTNFIAAIYTRRYVFRASGGVYPSTPSGRAVADVGRLTAYNGGGDQDPGAAPLGTSAGLFYVSPLLEV